MSFATSPAAVHLCATRRVASVTDLDCSRPLPHVTWKFRPTGYAHAYRGNWSHELDDVWWNGRHLAKPVHCNHRYYPNQLYSLRIYERHMIGRGQSPHFYLSPYYWEKHYW